MSMQRLGRVPPNKYACAVPTPPQASVKLVGCNVTENKAELAGGVLHAGSSGRMVGGSTNNSSSGDGSGSGSGSSRSIHNSFGGADNEALVEAVQLDGTVLLWNMAAFGGALGIAGRLGRFSASSTILDRCSAIAEGSDAPDGVLQRLELAGLYPGAGGVAWVGGSVGGVVFERGTLVTGSLVSALGSVLHANGPIGSIEITNAVVSRHGYTMTKGSEGVIYSTASIGSVHIQHSRVAKIGGGVLYALGNISSVAVINSSIVRVTDPVLFCNGSVGQVVVAENSNVLSNHADSGVSNGGGFLQVVRDLGSLVITNGSAVDGNTAFGIANTGGAVFVGGHLGRLEVSGNSSLSGNRVRSNGGAVAAGSLGSVIITGGSVVSNNVAGDNRRGGLPIQEFTTLDPASGGAIYVNMTLDTLELSSGARMEGNRATQN